MLVKIENSLQQGLYLDFRVLGLKPWGRVRLGSNGLGKI